MSNPEGSSQFVRSLLARGEPELMEVGRWQSRTARLTRFRDSQGKLDVVLKVGRDWPDGTARQRYQRMARLHDLLTEAGGGARVPQLLGWDDRPQAICMMFVEGTDLDELLKQGDVPAPLIVACGKTLGLYHTAEETTESDALERAWRDVERIAVRLLVSRRVVRRYRSQAGVARQYGDFAPYNFRIAADAALYLLDPPGLRHPGIVHRDLAWFLEHLERPRPRSELAKAFLAGYAASGPIDPRLPNHRWLVDLQRTYLRLALIRKRLRRRRYRDAARTLHAVARARLALRCIP